MTYEQALALAPLLDGKRIDFLDDLERVAFETLQAEGVADVVLQDHANPNSKVQIVEIIQPKQ